MQNLFAQQLGAIYVPYCLTVYNALAAFFIAGRNFDGSGNKMDYFLLIYVYMVKDIYF